jgi:glycosyltransferase involved in cell wall biosynthesis
MPPAVAYDLTRLCYAPPTPTPRGIDRVEIALASRFFSSWPGDCVAILPMPWGVRSLDRRFGLKVLDHVRAVWKEDIEASDDPAFAFVKQALNAEGNIEGRRFSRGKAPPLWRAVCARILRLWKGVGVPIGSSAVATAPKDAVYLNLGHIALVVDHLLGWLPRRPDIKPVFMLHDAIPLEHPEFVISSARASYGRMIANTARHAHGLIVTTESAKRAVLAALDERAPPPERIFSSPLPVDRIFRQPAVKEDFGPASYFVFCGAIEPRKNLLLLLTAWKTIADQLGAAAPKLVVVGARASHICETAAALDFCAAIRDHLVEVEGLSTNGLRTLLAGAKALLMPSLAEGFGIPIIEALACGTPVIASDIGAHREAGGRAVEYLDPTDAPAWARAIVSHHLNPVGSRIEAEIADWPSYYSALSDFITSIGRPAEQNFDLGAALAA